MESIAKQHKDPVMFEEFAALVFAPVLPQGITLLFTTQKKSVKKMILTYILE